MLPSCKSLALAVVYVQMSSIHISLSQVHITTSQRMTWLFSAWRCSAVHVPCSLEPAHTGSHGELTPTASLKRSPALPRSSRMCVFLCWSFQSLLHWGYLIRPSLLTGPSSDLGSGDRELQEVLEQGAKAVQEEVCVLHRLPITQRAPTLLSTHASREWPTSRALRWASSMAGSWGGSFSTELSCWKLCSKYRFPGGPEWSQLSSSGADSQICKQRDNKIGN